MKTLLPAAVVILFASVPAAQAAPHHGFWHLDEHATSGVRQAREIRAAIVSRFSLSHDYRDLVREADELVDTMNQIHDAVHSRRSYSTLRSMVDHAQFHLRNLDRRIGRSDYLHSSPGYRILTPTGYISYPATHHPGHIHVDSMQRMFDRLSSNLRQLETDLEPTIRIERRPFVYGYGAYGGW
jgi:hypothetical protein